MNRRNALKTSFTLASATLFLGGATFTISSCTPDTSDAWKPAFFDNNQLKLIAEIVERIIPKTETPGAKDVFIDRFIDENIALNFSPDQRSAFLDKLNVFDHKALEKFNKSFVKISDENKDSVLSELFEEAENQSSQPGQNDPHIVHVLRNMTTFGYFTSELIATEVLKYDPLPQDYFGCIDYDQVGGVWAL